MTTAEATLAASLCIGVIGPSSTVGATMPRAQMFAARCLAAGAGHVGRGRGLVDEHQAVRIEVELTLEPLPAPRQDVRALLLGRVRRLSFSLIRRRAKNRQSVEGRPARRPRPAPARISLKVCPASAPPAQGSAAHAPRSVPSGPGATEPACRCSAHQRIALDAPAPNRSAAARHDAPAAIVATIRSRRSTDNAFDMPVGYLPTDSLSQISSASGKRFESLRSEAAL